MAVKSPALLKTDIDRLIPLGRTLLGLDPSRLRQAAPSLLAAFVATPLGLGVDGPKLRGRR
jgi:hypothetical protein